MSENPAFPVAPRPFDGRSREVDAGACFEWLRQGWALFMDNPGVWIGTSVLLLVILIAISIPPLFGQIAVHLLLPIFAAGLLRLCRHQADGGEAQIADLFAGFKHNAGQLVIVGGIYTAGVFGIALIAFMLISGGVIGGTITGRVPGVGGFSFGGMMLAGLLVVVLSVPVIMATWFAPALVFFHDMQPVPAMKASFEAGAKNWVPMAVFGIILIIAGFFAMLPLGLGLLVLVPILTGAVYASYRDIFVGV